jgi:hypothetical protein
MFWNRLKFITLAILLVVGGVGLGIHWAVASAGPGRERTGGALDRHQALKLPAEEKEREPGEPPAPGKEAGKAEGRLTERLGLRREVVIRLPSGAFVKEVDAKPYGSGRLTWTYEEDRVRGLIEASVMGFEIELATEAEYSLSSTGAIYGLITSVHLRHLVFPEGKEFAELKPFAGLWSAAEPLVNDVLLDLPFSYQFRVQGDRLIISNFRILLAGPNPLGKLGGLVGAGGMKELAPLAYFQALSTALEGTYTAESKEKPAGNRRSPFFKPRGRIDSRPNR